jgi:hypothetical protein
MFFRNWIGALPMEMKPLDFVINIFHLLVRIVIIVTGALVAALIIVMNDKSN